MKYVFFCSSVYQPEKRIRGTNRTNFQPIFCVKILSVSHSVFILYTQLGKSFFDSQKCIVALINKIKKVSQKCCPPVLQMSFMPPTSWIRAH